jgi:hypothetical protein
VVTLVKMEGGTWKEAFEVWPAALVSGTSFAGMQYLASGTQTFHLVTVGVSGVFSVICTAAFIRFIWHPKGRFVLRSERPLEPARASVGAAARVDTGWHYRFTAGQTAYAWLPWAILVACCAIWGMPAFKAALNGLFSGVRFDTTLLGSRFAGTLSLPVWDMPALHELVQRAPPIAPPGAKPEAARFTVNWLSAAGTGVFVAALLSGLVLRLSAAQWKHRRHQLHRRGDGQDDRRTVDHGGVRGLLRPPAEARPRARPDLPHGLVALARRRGADRPHRPAPGVRVPGGDPAPAGEVAASAAAWMARSTSSTGWTARTGWPRAASSRARCRVQPGFALARSGAPVAATASALRAPSSAASRGSSRL